MSTVNREVSIVTQFNADFVAMANNGIMETVLASYCLVLFSHVSRIVEQMYVVDLTFS